MPTTSRHWKCVRRSSFLPEVAITRLGLAEPPRDHQPDERDEAVEQLGFAIREFREMKMQPSLERALYWQQSLEN